MATKSSQPGHSIVVTTAFELIGVSLLAILADSNKKAGTVAVTLMVGFGLIWLMTTGATFLQTILAHSPGGKNAGGGQPGVRKNA